mgnify:CR=1 FL=1
MDRGFALFAIKPIFLQQKNRCGLSIDFYKAVYNLVRNVRNKSYLSCLLDSCCKLSLMICAAACYSAGQNLVTLCHALSELSYILIVNEFSSVGTNAQTFFLVRFIGRTVDFSFFSLSDIVLSSLFWSERVIVIFTGFYGEIWIVTLRHCGRCVWSLCRMFRSAFSGITGVAL